ncbi:MAG: cytochrome ubiquinol oxidase subunit I [Burkholderiales bacterium]|nr:MAG: cytochrome ubiquinol oxidase subunit I [Burkholderiales bacterium]TAG82809.1 MAG: cytochrome ubiquinol oxidase subunit I [Betaproteobacteria bacterium]
MDPTSLILARIQFAANISFHILFPTITIALGWMLLFFRLRFRATRDSKWEEAYYFWTKIFALTFALGVVSGITMSFQFGTNWPGFMEKVGNIAGPLLGYEVLTAFFLEATFLGVMLFGRGRVSERMHLIATFLVAFGTTMSAFWILSLNSWMHTPVGYEIINGRFHATDWWAIVFNPSFPYRFTHMLLASGLTMCFMVAGVSAWQILKKVDSAATHAAFKSAIVAAAVLIPVQIFMGDLHGLNTLKHQPAKVAAMEGLWETEKGAPLVLFGIPDPVTRSNLYAIEIPKLASLILTHDPNGELKGLNDFEGKHPPVGPVFWSFRVMVGTGMLMLAASWLTVALLRKRTPATLPKPLLWGLSLMVFSGWVATLAGWYVTEIGRQPYIVYGVITVAETAAKHAPAMIGLTLSVYLALYAGLLIAYILVVKRLAEKATRGEALSLPTSFNRAQPSA